MHDLGKLQTLVLNADYRPLSYFPLSICTWQEAIKALLLERVDVVSEYETVVHSPSVTIKVPSVIALKNYITSSFRHPALTRHNLLLRDLYECQYCGEHFTSRALTLDHVYPRCTGGDTSWGNLVAACHPCNTTKGDKLPGVDFREPLHWPRRPTAKELQHNARILSAYHFHESWEDYLKS